MSTISKEAVDAAEWARTTGCMGYVARSTLEEFAQYVITTATAALTAKLKEQRDGSWLDNFGACKVCDGEIPHGHMPNCDVLKLEQKLSEARRQLEHALAVNANLVADQQQ
jgi:hypothetical protein